jgi:hypothetical protein
MKVCFTTNVEAIELLNTETAQEAQTFWIRVVPATTSVV